MLDALKIAGYFAQKYKNKMIILNNPQVIVNNK